MNNRPRHDSEDIFMKWLKKLKWLGAFLSIFLFMGVVFFLELSGVGGGLYEVSAVLVPTNTPQETFFSEQGGNIENGTGLWSTQYMSFKVREDNGESFLWIPRFHPVNVGDPYSGDSDTPNPIEFDSAPNEGYGSPRFYLGLSSWEMKENADKQFRDLFYMAGESADDLYDRHLPLMKNGQIPTLYYIYRKEITFRVVNGAWDDGTADDRIVYSDNFILPDGVYSQYGYYRNFDLRSIKLQADEIPAVGSKPGKGYQEGSWDIVPDTETVYGPGTVTFTYTYKEKKPISRNVTFKVENGAWNNGETEDVTVTLNGHEGDVLKLADGQIPAVGSMPAEHYQEGSWEKAPDTDTEITEDTTFKYVYTEKEKISRTVTFRVENGAWNDGKTEDVTVTLNGEEGDVLKLADGQIPAAGSMPADHYKEGSWEKAPDTDTEITEDTTYKYAYTEKEKISRTVTFKVVNGAWNDGKTEDMTVTLNGEEGDALKLADDQIPAVGSMPAEKYKEGSWDTVPGTDAEIKEDITYTYTYAEIEEISRTVTFKVVNGAWNDGKKEDITVTLTGYEGDTLKLAAGQIPAVGNKPADQYTAGKWDKAPDTQTEITENLTYTYTYAKKAEQAGTGGKNDQTASRTSARTGDNSRIWLWLMLMALSAVGLVTGVTFRERFGKDGR